MTRQAYVAASDEDIAKFLNLADLTNSECAQFFVQISDLNRQMFGEKIDKLKQNIIRKIGKQEFDKAADQIKMQTGASNRSVKFERNGL